MSKRVVKVRQAVKERVLTNIEQGRSYALVLGLVLLSYFVTGIVRGGGPIHALVLFIQGGVLLFALRVAHASRRVFRIGAVLWGLMLLVALGALLGSDVAQDIETVQASFGTGLARLASTALFGFTIGVIGVNLARRDRVDSETLMGVITIYLLLGMFFASLYLGVDALHDGPFFAQTFTSHGGQPDESEFLFFSFVTLTTVGYGNLVPIGDVGQTLASFEAVCGTLFLILAIGRTISVADSQKRLQEEREIRDTIRAETRAGRDYINERLDAAGIPRPDHPDEPPAPHDT